MMRRKLPLYCSVESTVFLWRGSGPDRKKLEASKVMPCTRNGCAAKDADILFLENPPLYSAKSH